MAQATMNQTEKTTAALNKQVANCAVLYMKLHNYHWFVKGEQFFTLHEKFEELYNEITEHMDELAERMLTIGGRPVADLRSCMQQATIQEASGHETPQEMVKTLYNDFNTVIKELQDGMATAEEQDDQTTSDLMLGVRSSLEKHNWMLKSFLA
jgi:starvation-inducible DNA-binding protein